MTPLRTAFALGFALLALGSPTIASASTDAGGAKTLAATLKSTAAIHTLMACHATSACQRTAALSLQRDVRAMASGVLVQYSGCDLLSLERAYGPTQTALAGWAVKPNAAHARVALGALHTWYAAVSAKKTCAR